MVSIVALLCLIAGVVCWFKTDFSLSEDKLHWLAPAVAFTAIFSAYSLVLGVADVLNTVYELVSSLIRLVK